MSRFFARLIGKEDFAKWDELVEKHGTIFQSIKWTEIFEPHIRRVGIFDKNGTLIGGFIYYEKRISGLKILLNPPYTPSIGPFYNSLAEKKVTKLNERREIIKTMAQYIDTQKAVIVSIQLSPGIYDNLPFFWKNYKVVPLCTYRINLLQDQEEIFFNFSPERRRNIKRALKDGILIEETSEVYILIDLVNKIFNRQNKKYPKTVMQKILERFPPGGENAKLFVAYDSSVPVSTLYMIFDKNVSYNLIPAHNPEMSHSSAGALLVWHAIQESQKMGLKIFDFEGSMIPSIEKFFRGFGGDLTLYYRINKAWLPIEMILKFFKRQYF